MVLGRVPQAQRARAGTAVLLAQPSPPPTPPHLVDATRPHKDVTDQRTPRADLERQVAELKRIGDALASALARKAPGHLAVAEWARLRQETR